MLVSRTQVRKNDPGDWRLRLARLATRRAAAPADGPGGPASAGAGGQQARFRDEFYPRLRQTAAVISSDGSFTPPAISDPPWCCARRTATVTIWRELGVGLPGRRFAEAASAGAGVDDGNRDPVAERAVLGASTSRSSSWGCAGAAWNRS